MSIINQKLELIQWLSMLKDKEILNTIQSIKENCTENYLESKTKVDCSFISEIPDKSIVNTLIPNSDIRYKIKKLSISCPKCNNVNIMEDDNLKLIENKKCLNCGVELDTTPWDENDNPRWRILLEYDLLGEVGKSFWNTEGKIYEIDKKNNMIKVGFSDKQEENEDKDISPIYYFWIDLNRD